MYHVLRDHSYNTRAVNFEIFFDLVYDGFSHRMHSTPQNPIFASPATVYEIKCCQIKSSIFRFRTTTIIMTYSLKFPTCQDLGIASGIFLIKIFILST